MPGSSLSDDPVDRLAMTQDPTTEFQRAAEIRDAAQRALFKQADRGDSSRRSSSIGATTETRYDQVMLFTFGEAALDPTYVVGLDPDWWSASRITSPVFGFPCEEL